MHDDSTHTIVRSAKRFFTGTAFSRLSGLFRDMAMAFAFGTQDAVAAFLVAFRFSHLLRRLLGEGALQTAFIPQFEQLRKEDPLRAVTFFRNICVGLTSLLILVVILTMAALWACLSFVEMSPGNQEIIWLTLLMMPGLLFICLFGLNASLLQCEKSFFTPSAAPIAFNLMWILGVGCLWKLDAPAAMPWLSFFVVLACVFQWVITIPKTLQILKKNHLKDLWKDINPFSKDVRNLAKPLFLGIIGVAASQINNALDAVFARYAESEGPAYLWYAIRMQQLPLALFGIAISGAILPPLTRAIKAHDHVKYHHFLEFALKRSMALMLPLSFAIFMLGFSSTNLIYGHGDFGSESVQGTTRCLWGYGLGLVPMTIVLILAPAFYAQENYRIPTIASVISMVLNVVLNTLLIAGFGYGAASVAVATSVSAWANAIILAWMLYTKNGPLVTRSYWSGFAKVCIAGLCGAAGVIGFNFATQSLHLNKAYQFGSEFFIFFGVLWASALVIRADEILQLIQTGTKRQILE